MQFIATSRDKTLYHENLFNLFNFAPKRLVWAKEKNIHIDSNVVKLSKQQDTEVYFYLSYTRTFWISSEFVEIFFNILVSHCQKCLVFFSPPNNWKWFLPIQKGFPLETTLDEIQEWLNEKGNVENVQMRRNLQRQFKVKAQLHSSRFFFPLEFWLFLLNSVPMVCLCRDLCSSVLTLKRHLSSSWNIQT